MASASPLWGLLTAEEFQTLNDHVRVKLEDFARRIENDASQLKIQLAKQQTQSGELLL